MVNGRTCKHHRVTSRSPSKVMIYLLQNRTIRFPYILCTENLYFSGVFKRYPMDGTTTKYLQSLPPRHSKDWWTCVFQKIKPPTHWNEVGDFLSIVFCPGHQHSDLPGHSPSQCFSAPFCVVPSPATFPNPTLPPTGSSKRHSASSGLDPHSEACTTKICGPDWSLDWIKQQQCDKGEVCFDSCSQENIDHINWPKQDDGFPFSYLLICPDRHIYLYQIRWDIDQHTHTQILLVIMPDIYIIIRAQVV